MVMKLFIAPVLLLFSLLSFANDTISGSKSAYQYDKSQKLTPAPKNYQPFYINHVGRHGSRYISKPKHEEITLQILQQAKEQKQLTAQGKKLLNQLTKINELNRDHYGALTDLGKTDISKIAQRMLNTYPTVFRANHIDVMSTTIPRAIDSAKAFLQPFSSLYPDLTITQQPEDSQVLLRFFEYAPAYLNYKKSQEIKTAVNSLEKSALTKQISQKIADKLFSKSFAARLKDGIEINDDKIKTRDFVLSLFAIYQETLSFSPATCSKNNINLAKYFSSADKKWLTTVITAKNYLQIGPAFDIHGIQINIAAPLLREIITSSETAINDDTINANFRFAHAETISPLATLLELDGTTNITDAIENYPNYWKAEQIIPMGANIQFIFYRHKTKPQPILVKVLLNEREVHLPIKTAQYPYYLWQDVKAFYWQKLAKLGLDEKQDAKEFLINLK